MGNLDDIEVKGHVWYDLDQVARIFRVKRRTILNWCNRSEKFPNRSRPVNNRWMIPGHDILAALHQDYESAVNYKNESAARERVNRLQDTVHELNEIIADLKLQLAAKETENVELNEALQAKTAEAVELDKSLNTERRYWNRVERENKEEEERREKKIRQMVRNSKYSNKFLIEEMKRIDGDYT